MRKLSLITIIICLFIATITNSIQAAPKTGQSNFDSSIKKLIAAAQIGTDDKFKNFLEQEKQATIFPAPQTLRKFYTVIPTTRTGMSIGYFNDCGKNSIVWWTGEVAMRGEQEEIENKIRGFFKSEGFSQTSDLEERKNEDPMKFSKVKNGVTIEAFIDKPMNFIGGQDKNCGTHIGFKVTDNNTSGFPSLAAILKIIPSLKDPRIEEKVYNTYSKNKVMALSSGGTWTRYYDWDVSFITGSPKEISTKTSALAKELGYENYEDADQLVTLRRAATGSFLYISPPEQSGKNVILRVRFQPES